MEKIRQLLPDVDILVVDDNSPDGTGQWVDEQAAEDTRIRCLHRAGKLGLGTATIEIMEYARSEDYTYLVALDADGSHDPTYIPQMLACMNAERHRPDVVIGSRYVAGGGTRNWPFYRRWMSRGEQLCPNLAGTACQGLQRCFPLYAH